MKTGHTCSLPRPTNTDYGGPGARQRPLLLLQRWVSGIAGELVLEPHRDHVHLWWRWGDDWEKSMAPEDWTHFDACVLPIVRDLVEAFRCCAPLDIGSAKLIGERAA